MYQILTKLISKNRSNKLLKFKGIVLHETANAGATALNHFNYFNTADRQAAAHFFVDWDCIINNVPIEEQAWHAGKTANAYYIGIEMCHATNRADFEEVWKRTVWLCAKILNEHGIKKISLENFLSHAEVSRMFKETDHLDPESYFAAFGKTMNDFRIELQGEINCMEKPLVDHWAEKYYEELKAKGIEIDEKRFDDSITRGEVFALLFRVLEKVLK